MSKPISPDQIGEAKRLHFPPAVFDAVNGLIAENFTGGRANFTQDEVVQRILQLDSTMTRQKVFDNGYLNFEEAYRDAGWSVDYDKPGYNESYNANFTFRKKR